MKNLRGFLTKSDLLVISIIVLLAAVSSLPHFLLAKEPAAAIVIANQSVDIYHISLQQLEKSVAFSETFTCATGPVTFSFDPGHGVRVGQASCPDRLCMRMGYIKTARQMIVCLPGKIYAEVRQDKAGEGEVDAILH